MGGGGYFVLLTFEKLTNLHKRKLNKVAETAYRIFTLFCVVVAWVVFRSNGLRNAFKYLLSMFGLAGGPLYDNNAIRYGNDYKILFIIAIICSTPALTKLRRWLGSKLKAETAVNAAFDLVAVALTVVSVSYLVMGGNNPFIYFNF